MPLITQLHDELMPHSTTFQEAGAVGLDMIAQLPYNGNQWKYRYLQRAPFIYGASITLPRQLNSFRRIDNNLNGGRLAYFSEELGVELSFRRRGSTSTYQGLTSPSSTLETPQQDRTLALFPIPPGYGSPTPPPP